MRANEFLLEVKIITSGDIEHLTEPLKDTDTIRVYHGTSDINMVVIAITRGLSGDTKANRKYSYEFNNNPKGLFVTPDFNTVKEFGDYVLEIHAQVKDLEAPVWPNGTFTVQGGMSGIFKNNDEREQERIRQRKIHSSSKSPTINNSDRPELAASLYDFGERQALFIGDLNANSIRAIWVSTNPKRINQPYKRYSPQEFLKIFKSEGIPDRYGRNNKEIDAKSELVQNANRKEVNPRDNVTLEMIVSILQNRYKKLSMTREKIIEILKKNPDYIRDMVWSDRQYQQVMNDLQSIQ